MRNDGQVLATKPCSLCSGRLEPGQDGDICQLCLTTMDHVSKMNGMGHLMVIGTLKGRKSGLENIFAVSKVVTGTSKSPAISCGEMV